MLALYRALIALRRVTRALAIGGIAIAVGDSDVLAYERWHDDDRLLIALNLCAEPRQLLLPVGVRIAEVLASTLPSHPMDGTLHGDEGLVLRLERDD